MTTGPRPFAVTVMGEPTLAFGDQVVSLSPGSRLALYGMVAAGPRGIHIDDLIAMRRPGLANDEDQSKEMAGVRMVMSRLRQSRRSAFPTASNGRYRLGLRPEDVDVWWLEEIAIAFPAEPDKQRLFHVLNPAEVYRGIDDHNLIDRSRNRIDRARKQLLDHVREQRPDLLGDEFLNFSRPYLEANPLNENIVEATAVAYGRSGSRAEGLRLINETRRELAAVGLELRSSLVHLEQELLAGADPKPASAGEPQPAPMVLPPSLSELRASPLHGPPSELATVTAACFKDDGETTRWAEIAGPPGIGKQRLAAECAALAGDRGMAVLHLSPRSTDDAYGALRAALPLFADDLDELVDSSGTNDRRWIRVSNALRDRLSQFAAGRRLLVVLTDGDLIDRYSAALLKGLSHRPAEMPIVVLMTGDGRPIRIQPAPLSDPTTDHGNLPSPWRDLLAGLRRQSGLLSTVEMAPFTPTMMRQLVRHHRPDFSEPMTRNIGEALLASTEGLPGVAIPVLRALDERGMLSNPNGLSPSAILSDAIDQLSNAVRSVGAACAVLGPIFEFDELVQLVGEAKTDELLNAVQDLWHRNLIEELPNGRLRMNIVVREAFLRSVLGIQIRQWNTRAAALFASDPHRRARHLRATGSSQETIDALIRSADVYLDDGLYFEAAQDYRWAALIRRRPLEPEVAGRYARALDLSGLPADAAKVRRIAFDTLIEDRPEDALLVALSGQPEAESIDGNSDLLADLQRLDRAKLGPGFRHEHAWYLARQLTLHGRPDEAMGYAETASRLAVDPAQQVSGAVIERFVLSASSEPEKCIARLDTVEAQAMTMPVAKRAEYLIHLAVDCYQAGATARLNQIRSVLETQLSDASPRSKWQALLADATLAADAGRIDESRSIRSDAASLGASLGIVEALPARVAGDFAESWLAGGVTEFADRLTTTQFDRVNHWSKLARLGGLLVLAERDGPNDEQVLDGARKLATDVLERPNPHATTVLAMLTPLIADLGDPALIERTHRVLSMRGPSMILVGAFVASLGPVGRYLASLTPRIEERRALLEEALDVATAAGSARWIDIAQRDLQLLPN